MRAQAELGGAPDVQRAFSRADPLHSNELSEPALRRLSEAQIADGLLRAFAVEDVQALTDER